MIKNIAYYPLQRALNGGPPMNAMLSALRDAGIETQECSRDSDAVLIWSALWSGRMAANQAVYRHYRAQGKPAIIIDIGALHRGTTWKVAVNNVNATGYYGHMDNLDWDRPRKMNLKLGTPANPKSHIVIAAQHTQSEQLAGVDLDQWIRLQIQLLRNNTDRPIHIRPHPRCSINTAGLSSLAYPVGVGLADIEQPYTTNRDLWLAQISHTEYTVPELEQGLWLRRIELALA